MTVGAALLRQLYCAPPDGFTAARDAAVAEARARGDAAAAKEIAALRKPTIAAWLVNLLAIRRPELLADLAALAGEMRVAQRELRGAELRELSAQRRRVVASLVAEARALAAASGAEAAKLPLGEVEDTLNAALSDEGIATSVRSGRLLRPVTYAGFGEVPRPRLRLVTADADDTEERPAKPGRATRPGAGEARPPQRAELSRRAEDAEPTRRAGDGEPSRRAEGGEPTRRAGDGEPTRRAEDAEPSRRAEDAEPSRRAEDAEPSRRAEDAEPSRRAEDAEPTRRAEDAEPTRSAEDAEITRLAREAERARRGLERAEREAFRDRERAGGDLTAAEEDERAAVAAVADLSARIAALQAERGEAEQEAGRRKLARKAAERAAVAARRRHGDAAAALEALPPARKRSPGEGGTAENGPFVEPAAPFAETVTRKGAARRGRADRDGVPKAESGA